MRCEQKNIQTILNIACFALHFKTIRLNRNGSVRWLRIEMLNGTCTHVCSPICLHRHRNACAWNQTISPYIYTVVGFFLESLWYTASVGDSASTTNNDCQSFVCAWKNVDHGEDSWTLALQRYGRVSIRSNIDNFCAFRIVQLSIGNSDHLSSNTIMNKPFCFCRINLSMDVSGH